MPQAQQGREERVRLPRPPAGWLMRILKRDVVCLASDLAVGLSAYVITFRMPLLVGWWCGFAWLTKERKR